MILSSSESQLVNAHEGAADHSHAENAIASSDHVTIRVGGTYRVIESDGLPNHHTGSFPNGRNPNRISAQRHRYRVPLEPVAAAQPTPLGMHPFGVAINGVPFDPGAAEFWKRNPRSGWQYEAMSDAVDLGLDQSNAHVQPTGAYHYHGLPVGLIDQLGGDRQQMTLLGYAADGFPIYSSRGHGTTSDASSKLVKLKPSYQLRSGTRPDGVDGPGGRHDGTFVADWKYVEGSGDLDASNGRFGVTPEYPQGTYYYVLTDSFPFIPRQFHGTPDASFLRHGPGAGGRPPFGGPPRGRRPPPEFRPPRR